MGSIYFDGELCLRLWEVTQLKSLVPKPRKPWIQSGVVLR